MLLSVPVRYVVDLTNTLVHDIRLFQVAQSQAMAALEQQGDPRVLLERGRPWTPVFRRAMADLPTKDPLELLFGEFEELLTCTPEDLARQILQQVDHLRDPKAFESRAWPHDPTTLAVYVPDPCSEVNRCLRVIRVCGCSNTLEVL